MEMNDEYAIGRSFASSRDLGAGGGGSLGNLAAQPNHHTTSPRERALRLTKAGTTSS